MMNYWMDQWGALPMPNKNSFWQETLRSMMRSLQLQMASDLCSLQPHAEAVTQEMEKGTPSQHLHDLDKQTKPEINISDKVDHNCSTEPYLDSYLNQFLREQPSLS